MIKKEAAEVAITYKYVDAVLIILASILYLCNQTKKRSVL